MYRTFGGQPYRRFAEDVAAPVVASVRDGSVARSGMLGHAGSGSVAYGLAALAELLDQDVYRDAALAAAEAIDREAVEADDRIDVVDGSAGALLGLCKCHEVTGAADPLERAVVAGDHLLEGADVRDGRPVWTTGDRDRPLQGFAHGVAGIAYALSRLGDLTDEPRYGRVARESVAFEDELYDHDRHNWRDVRAETDAFTSSWCHGRAGIGLARLGLARHTSDSAPARDVTCALAGTDHERVLDRDHVCCGNFGRVGWLAAAADWRDDPSTRDRAVELAARVARRARRNERFLGPYQTERLYDPTFFTGEAGVGYVCCRLLNPELPSVLLAE